MQYDWQTESHPTCNAFHEVDLRQQLGITFSSSSSLASSSSSSSLSSLRSKGRKLQKHEPDSMRARLLAAGGYRNVWMIHNGTEYGSTNINIHSSRGSQGGDSDLERERPIALKTLLYERDWYPIYYARHNLDALVTSRLSSSPYIADQYGYCGASGFYEFAKGGNLLTYTERNFYDLDSQMKLELSYQVAQAIADLHNKVGQEGQPVVAHTDIFPDQFVQIHSHDSSLATNPFKLNDFNRARWIHKPSPGSNATHESCGFSFPKNLGKFRSPEEYAYKMETEKIDIYSMGNIFYFLLTGEAPFLSRSRDTVKRVLKSGRRQPIPDVYQTSSDPIVKGLIKAIQMCWIHSPADRATARQVEQHLSRLLTNSAASN